MASQHNPEYLTLGHASTSRQRYSRNWSYIARASSSLILLGILALPPLFLPAADLHTSKTLVTVLALAAVTAGLSLTPLLCFAVSDQAFRLREVLLPSLQSCGIGLVALIYYTGVFKDASFRDVPAILSICLAAVAVVIYGVACLWMSHSLKRRVRFSPHSGSIDITASSPVRPDHSSRVRRSQSTGTAPAYNRAYHSSSLSESSATASLWNVEPAAPISVLGTNVATYHPSSAQPSSTVGPGISSRPSAVSRHQSDSATSQVPLSPVGDVYGEGEAPVIKVTRGPRMIEEEEMRAQMARLLLNGEGRRIGEQTFHIEMPRNGLERRQTNTFRIEMPKGSSVVNEEELTGAGPSAAPQVRILGPMASQSTHVRATSASAIPPSSSVNATLKPLPANPSAGDSDIDDDDPDRLSWQKTPVEYRQKARPPFNRALSREDRRKEIELGIRLQ